MNKDLIVGALIALCLILTGVLAFSGYDTNVIIPIATALVGYLIRGTESAALGGIKDVFKK